MKRTHCICREKKTKPLVLMLLVIVGRAQGREKERWGGEGGRDGEEERQRKQRETLPDREKYRQTGETGRETKN